MSRIFNFVEYEAAATEVVTRLHQPPFSNEFAEDIQQIILDVQTLDLQLRLLDDSNSQYSLKGFDILGKRLEACRAALVQLLDDSNGKMHNHKSADDILRTKRSIAAATQTCSVIMQSVACTSAETRFVLTQFFGTARIGPKTVVYDSFQSSGHARVHAGDVYGNVTYYVNSDPFVNKSREP